MTSLAPLLCLRGENSRLEIAVVGYQYPHETEAYDSEWLVLEVCAVVGSTVWTRRDPAIIARDLRWIVDWFAAIGSGNAPAWPHLGFWEQNLSFEYLAHVGQGRHSIAVHLNYEFKPPGWESDDDYTMRFEVSETEAAEIARAVTAAMQVYPVRSTLP
jgi:hypothetical protein